MYLNDDGTRQVFIDSTKTGDIAQPILDWLTNPPPSENQTERLIKQATISVGGNRLVISQGAFLEEYLVSHNITITTS